MSLPPHGVARVHPNPATLFLPREGDPAGRSRFDDPRGAFAVRYAAGTLRGCLVEVMARFRPSPVAEQLLAGIEEERHL